MNVAIIPARGGSRRIPRKNIREFFGRPIIAYSIDTARRSELFQRIIVSTDSEEIAQVAAAFGAEAWRRPEHYARDEIGTQEVARSVLLQWQGNPDRYGPFDAQYACVIYATAPLMLAADLRRGWHFIQSRDDIPYAYSCALQPQRENGLRWDAGQWYWGKVQSFLGGISLEAENVIRVIISPERVCDINEESDWLRAQALYSEMMRDKVKA